MNQWISNEWIGGWTGGWVGLVDRCVAQAELYL